MVSCLELKSREERSRWTGLIDSGTIPTPGLLTRSWLGSVWRGTATSTTPSVWRIDSCTCALQLLQPHSLEKVPDISLLFRMTTAFVDFNGVVPEKFDAVKLSHLVDAEYGNQGIDFKMVPREGFGWMNGASRVSFYVILPWSSPTSLSPHTSLHTVPLRLSRPVCYDLFADNAVPIAAYQVGLSFLTTHMRRAVATCTSPEVFFSASTSGLKDSVEGGVTTDPLSLAMEALNL